MRAWRDRVLRGRIHGRSLLVLIAVAALVSAAAVWQFGSLRDDHDPDVADAELTEAPRFTAEAESAAPSSSAPSSAVPDPSAEPASAEPTTTAEAATSEATEAAVAGPVCTASLTLADEWSSSISVSVEVANTGTERIDGWEVVLDLAGLDVTALWGLDHVDGDRYGDIMFNAGIDPGSSVGPSFQADVEGEWTLPATVPCTPEA
ncbi:hypothetical protein GCM10009830_09640 [Glycomyces endophyticus]|uniref:CBM2 domain-containing protein n=1 Tax=Glycomyces endophyticus TaxID=480996 RepID=A0ABP4S9J1_9ACTN